MGNDVDNTLPWLSEGRGGRPHALETFLGRARVHQVETNLAPYEKDLAAILGRNLEDLSDDDLSAAMADLKRDPGEAWPTGHGDCVRHAYSLVREAARRALGLDPFPEQVVAALAMARGRVAELPTGEGKTLAAVFPAALQALAGRGVHVLTFNDYLARRDAEWMGAAYRLLGLSVGCVQEGMAPAARRAAYSCDVTYLTAKEAGFDLLRDGLVLEPEHRVHRPFHAALIDEADSILIDEARIPLVIAGVRPDREEGLGRLAELARHLEHGVDFGIDDSERNIYLNDRGVERAEAELGCGDLFSGAGVGVLAGVRNALHAEHLFRRDVDYIVRDGAVELVDELTGRVAERRHWPDGLQAAVETKEGLNPGDGGSILGSITLQHFLVLYPHLCGMTATAASAARELREVYGLEVAVVPPHRPCIRVDDGDLVFVDGASRDRAVVEEVVRVHESGQPVLVGTGSVEASERLAAELRERGVPCSVLNARNDEEEAGIVAGAGDLRRVTISTNMAGRGTDIRLGGGGERNRDRAVELGGLYVIGTTRHSSVRIDRQLRGRAGRQGDPGRARFFVSFEDDLLRHARVDRLVPGVLAGDGGGAPLDARAVRRAVLHAQRVAEGECCDARMRLARYSEVLEQQRRLVQEWRQEVLTDGVRPSSLEVSCPVRWKELEPMVGEGVLHSVERRLTLLAIDACWSEHLDEMRLLRDEIHLAALGGGIPLVEYTRQAIAGFDDLTERVQDMVVGAFERLRISAAGIDWEEDALRGPTATWTYLVDDNAFAPNVMRTLANHAGIALWAVLLWWPLLFVWGLYLHLKRRRHEVALAPFPCSGDHGDEGREGDSESSKGPRI